MGDVASEVNAAQVYLRGTLKLDDVPRKPVFYVVSSDDCQLFINGQLVRNLACNRHWQSPVETCVMLRSDELSVFRKGENLIAAVLVPSDCKPYLEVRMYNFAEST